MYELEEHLEALLRERANLESIRTSIPLSCMLLDREIHRVENIIQQQQQQQQQESLSRNPIITSASASPRSSQIPPATPPPSQQQAQQQSQSRIPQAPPPPPPSSSSPSQSAVLGMGPRSKTMPGGPIVKKRVKIPVPAEKYPEYNFVGRLLGPRGATLKTLERETGCKIMIRGRGSIRKDKENEVRGKPGWEHVFNEPLHVVLEAETEEAIATRQLNRAKEAVELLLVPVPEDRDSLKRQQLRDLAILNGTFRGQPAFGSAGGALSSSPNASQAPSSSHASFTQAQAQASASASASITSPNPYGSDGGISPSDAIELAANMNDPFSSASSSHMPTMARSNTVAAYRSHPMDSDYDYLKQLGMGSTGAGGGPSSSSSSHQTALQRMSSPPSLMHHQQQQHQSLGRGSSPQEMDSSYWSLGNMAQGYDGFAEHHSVSKHPQHAEASYSGGGGAGASASSSSATAATATNPNRVGGPHPGTGGALYTPSYSPPPSQQAGAAQNVVQGQNQGQATYFAKTNPDKALMSNTTATPDLHSSNTSASSSAVGLNSEAVMYPGSSRTDLSVDEMLATTAERLHMTSLDET